MYFCQPTLHPTRPACVVEQALSRPFSPKTFNTSRRIHHGINYRFWKNLCLLFEQAKTPLAGGTEKKSCHYQGLTGLNWTQKLIKLGLDSAQQIKKQKEEIKLNKQIKGWYKHSAGSWLIGFVLVRSKHPPTPPGAPELLHLSCPHMALATYKRWPYWSCFAPPTVNTPSCCPLLPDRCCAVFSGEISSPLPPSQCVHSYFR